MSPIQKPDLPAPSPLDAADPFHASEAVRRRIRRRWEQRRADSGGVVRAWTSWGFVGPYAYPLGHERIMDVDEIPNLTPTWLGLVCVKMESR